MDECYAMGQKILKKGGYAVSLAKRVINAGMDMDLASGLELEATSFGLAFSTHDKYEGM